MVKKMEAQGLRVLNLIFFFLMIAVNIGAELLPLNNTTTQQVSALHNTLLTPPGFTFAVWGVIYSWLFLFILFQFGLFRKKGTGDNPDFIHSISVFFIISCVFNMGWIIAWHYDLITLCFVLIFAMWASLFYAFIRLKKEATNAREYFFIQMPFSLYLAWISAAMMINYLIMIKTAVPGLLGLSETAWSSGLIIALFLLTELILFRYRDFTFAIGALWAFAGILYHYSMDIGKQELNTNMLLLLAIVVGTLLVSLLITAWVQHYKPYMA